MGVANIESTVFVIASRVFFLTRCPEPVEAKQSPRRVRDCFAKERLAMTAYVFDNGHSLVALHI